MALKNYRITHVLPCLAFAVEMLNEEKSVVRCAPLFTPEHKERRKILLELLQVAGYSVPANFL